MKNDFGSGFFTSSGECESKDCWDNAYSGVPLFILADVDVVAVVGVELGDILAPAWFWGLPICTAEVSPIIAFPDGSKLWFWVISKEFGGTSDVGVFTLRWSSFILSFGAGAPKIQKEKGWWILIRNHKVERLIQDE